MFLAFFREIKLNELCILNSLSPCSETEKEQVKEIEAAESETQLRAFLKENFDDSQTESTAGSDQFKPFAKDPTKQKRYEQYLVCVQNGRGKIALKILQVNNLQKVPLIQHFIECRINYDNTDYGLDKAPNPAEISVGVEELYGKP